MTELSSVQKVTRSGNSLMIVLPKKIREILDIKLGDYIKVDWLEVIKQRKTKDIDIKVKKSVIKPRRSEDIKEEEELPNI